jgi:hypothetical protein
VGATATGLYHWLERHLFETPVGLERHLIERPPGLERHLMERPLGRERRRPVTVPGLFAGRAHLCPALYFIVLVFNLAVTAALGEWGLLLSGVALTLPVVLWTAGVLFGRRRAAGTRVRGAWAYRSPGPETLAQED